jgi:putative ubiquitin-RnfH superfamily antitoxin RatB of RatAB toxin-antitoxin module
MLRIEVVHCPAPGQVDQTRLDLPAGSSIADAVRASGVVERHGMDARALPTLGVWGRIAAPQTLLRDRDRVEVYRALTIDPMEARRRRQGPRGR